MCRARREPRARALSSASSRAHLGQLSRRRSASRLDCRARLAPGGHVPMMPSRGVAGFRCRTLEIAQVGLRVSPAPLTRWRPARRARPGVVHVGAPLAQRLEPGRGQVALVRLAPQPVFKRRATLVVVGQRSRAAISRVVARSPAAASLSTSSCAAVDRSAASFRRGLGRGERGCGRLERLAVVGALQFAQAVANALPLFRLPGGAFEGSSGAVPARSAGRTSGRCWRRSRPDCVRPRRP